MEKVKKLIRDIPDFPRKGVVFKDITTLLKDGPSFGRVIDLMAARYKNKKIDVVVGVEARGFIMGAALAYKLKAGVIPIRKAGKLPYKTHRAEYKLEYGKDALEIHIDAIKPGDKVLIADDLLATGGTVRAAIDLVKKLKGEIVEATFLIELTFLNGRKKLRPHKVFSLIQY